MIKLFSLLLKIEINLQKLYYKFNIALASDSILTNESYLYNYSKKQESNHLWSEFLLLSMY